jgi:hypothetical protein
MRAEDVPVDPFGKVTERYPLRLIWNARVDRRVAEATLYTEGSKDLLHAQRLEDRVYGIGIKASLELCK